MKTYSALLVTFLLAASSPALADTQSSWCIGLAQGCQTIGVGPGSPICATTPSDPPSLTSNCCNYLLICPPPANGGEFAGELNGPPPSEPSGAIPGTPGDGLGLGDPSDTNTDFTPENFDDDDGPQGFSARRDSRSFFSNGNSNGPGASGESPRDPNGFFK
jgi:hypothetical protein